MNVIDNNFIAEVEKAHFRTVSDTGANHNAMFIWNLVRRHIGLPALTREQLPAYCMTHGKYHIINLEYGCRRIESTDDAKKVWDL